MAINEQLILEIKSDVSQLKKGIAQSKQAVSGLKKQLQGVSSTLKIAFAAALGLAARAAINSAKDFDKSMTKIKALVGVAGDEVDKMGESVKRMAMDTGVSANEAAEALFFITSAGLEGKDAMNVLEASLKAAAVGLGEAKTIADLATSALNAYGAENLSASEATDVMVSAVREGKLESSELASAMGKVLPLASAMGVEFHEVGAAFAALSRTGTNAAEAATQIRGIFASLLKPTGDADKALLDMGLSAEGLRAQLKEEGLIATLETLKTKFEGNDTAAQSVFGNVRALSGVLDLLGANVGTTREIFDELNSSLGATDVAFEIAAESAEFKLNKALNEMAIIGTELGGIVLPLLAGAMQTISDVFTGQSYYTRKLKEDQDELTKSIEANAKKEEERKKKFQEFTDFLTGEHSRRLALEKKALEIEEEIKRKDEERQKRIRGLTKASDEYTAALTKLENQETVLGEAFDFTQGKIDLINDTLIDLLNNGLGTTKMFKDLKNELDNIKKVGIIKLNIDDELPEFNIEGYLKQEPELQKALDDRKTWAENLILIDEEANKTIAENQAKWDAEELLTRETQLAELAEQDALLQEERLVALETMGQYVSAFTQTIAAGLTQMTDGLVDSFGLADKGIQGFVKSMLKALAQVAIAQLTGLIQKKIMAKIQTSIDKKQAQGSSITAATNTAAAMGPAGFYALAPLIASALAITTGAFAGVKAFAKGGVVTTPMMGLVGEAGPEAIIPLNRLDSMMGGGDKEFTIRGQDLVLAMDRANGFKSRITG